MKDNTEKPLVLTAASNEGTDNNEYLEELKDNVELSEEMENLMNAFATHSDVMVKIALEQIRRYPPCGRSRIRSLSKILLPT